MPFLFRSSTVERGSGNVETWRTDILNKGEEPALNLPPCKSLLVAASLASLARPRPRPHHQHQQPPKAGLKANSKNSKREGQGLAVAPAPLPLPCCSALAYAPRPETRGRHSKEGGAKLRVWKARFCAPSTQRSRSCVAALQGAARPPILLPKSGLRNDGTAMAKELYRVYTLLQGVLKAHKGQT